MRILLFCLLICLSSCWAFRAFKVRKLLLTDHQKLPSVTIQASRYPFYFHYPDSPARFAELASGVDSLISGTETAAFLVIRNDTLLYEKYFMGFSEVDLLPSNSMAKSFTGTLVGIALKERKIQSVFEPITHYLPELGKRDRRFHDITIRHLLDMRSGLDFDEGSYTLRDDAVKLGFRPNLVKHILKARVKEPPGNFKYQSINPQLLGIIIERATGMTLQDYFEQKLWQPIGAEHAATWNVDSKKRKHVITSAAINATAHDFAKLGRLYLNQGMLNNVQIIDRDWVRTVSSADSLEKYEGYKYQWWNKRGTQYYKDSVLKMLKLKRPGKNQPIPKTDYRHYLGYATDAFNAYGFLDQMIYVHPDKNIIIVRLGRGWKKGSKFIQSIYGLGEQL
jgi:CubicO group peptidase (beta-lactamase class C family)